MNVELMKKVAPEALKCLREFIKEAGGCDHTVGICMCPEIRICEQLEEAITGKNSQPEFLSQALNEGDGTYKP